MCMLHASDNTHMRQRRTYTCQVHCMLHALGMYKARRARLVRPIGPRYACACYMCMQPSPTAQDHHTNGPRHARPVCPYGERGAADLTSKHIARESITPWHRRLPKSGRRPHTRPPAHLGATKPKSRLHLRFLCQPRHRRGRAGTRSIPAHSHTSCQRVTHETRAKCARALHLMPGSCVSETR